MKHTKGIGLIVLIIIILIVAMAVLGIAIFISRGLFLNTVRASMEQAIFAAQAGVCAGISAATPPSYYWYKTSNVNILGNGYVRYSVGKDANFLLVDADNPKSISSDGLILQRIPLTNLNSIQAITVNQMKVEWDFGGTLDLVVLGGVEHLVSATSGQIFSISPQFTMNAQQSFMGDGDNFWMFRDSIPSNAIVIVTFYFTDGSSRKAYLLNNGRSGNREFSITATGQVRGFTNWKRTIEATYDAGVDRITSWQEVDSHI